MSASDMEAAFARAERETAQAIRKLNITDAQHIELWLEAHVEADADLGWLASCIADAHKSAFASEVLRLRGFIQSIDDDWIQNNPAGDDEWNDGYEDCLSDYALKARKILRGDPLESVLS